MLNPTSEPGPPADLFVHVVWEPQKPENNEKYNETVRVDNSRELQHFKQIFFLRFLSPENFLFLRCLWILSECIYVGLHDDVQKSIKINYIL